MKQSLSLSLNSSNKKTLLFTKQYPLEFIAFQRLLKSFNQLKQLYPNELFHRIKQQLQTFSDIHNIQLSELLTQSVNEIEKKVHSTQKDYLINNIKLRIFNEDITDPSFTILDTANLEDGNTLQYLINSRPNLIEYNKSSKITMNCHYCDIPATQEHLVNSCITTNKSRQDLLKNLQKHNHKHDSHNLPKEMLLSDFIYNFFALDGLYFYPKSKTTIKNLLKNFINSITYIHRSNVRDNPNRV